MPYVFTTPLQRIRFGASVLGCILPVMSADVSSLFVSLQGPPPGVLRSSSPSSAEVHLSNIPSISWRNSELNLSGGYWKYHWRSKAGMPVICGTTSIKLLRDATYHDSCSNSWQTEITFDKGGYLDKNSFFENAYIRWIKYIFYSRFDTSLLTVSSPTPTARVIISGSEWILEKLAKPQRTY